MPGKKVKTSSRGRKKIRSRSSSYSAPVSRPKSRSRSVPLNGAVRARKPRQVRSHSKSRERLYPMGHDKKRSRSRSKAKLRDDTCKSLQAMDNVSESMSLTELQLIAKKKGIAFGGLSKKQLVRKICHYS